MSRNQEQGKVNSLTSHNTVQLQCPQHTVLLSTAVIQVFDKTGNIHSPPPPVVEFFLIVAVNPNFISEHLCRILNLTKQKTNFTLSGIGQTVETAKYKVSIKINNSAYENILPCFVLPSITGDVPAISFPRSELNIPNNIALADPNFSTSTPIDLLIGADTFWELFNVGQIKLGKDMPILQKPRLG